MDSNALPTDRNWKYRQFRGQEQDKLKGILSDTDAIQKYQKDPFNAHAIARLRPTSYQKAVVMRYIDNLLDWADDLFTRFQMESVNEAMMLYVTAAEILGPRPAQLGECGELVDSTRTYDKLKDSISQDGEFLLEVEELITVPSTAASSEGVGVGGWSKPMFGLGALLTFPISNAQASEEVGSGLLGGITDTEFTANKVAAKIGSIVSGDPGGGPPSASTVSMSPGTVGAAAMSGGPLVPGATAGAVMSGDAAKMSQATTSFVAGKTAALFGEGQLSGSTVASTAAIAGENVPGGRIDDGATSVGTTSFTKAALALPRTEALLQSFTSQQQFRFLGGEWKVSGGLRVSPTLGDHFSLALVRQIVAAFCIPRNELLDDYWNRVEDRIQKIRTCRDITGLQRKLSLFAPPIDPNLLARVRALGIPLDEAIGVFEGVIPQYRFPYLLEKAKAFVGTVQSFGAMLQAALERKDSEELVLLQATQQQQILALTTRAKEWEIESAQVNLEATERRRTAVENRRAHYADLVGAGLNEWETAESISTNIASIIRGSGAQINFGAAVLGLTPQIGSPFAMKYGGVELEKGQKDAALAMGYLADQAIHVAASAGLEAGHKRRSEDWTFQRDQAIDELSQIDKQIEVARIGLDLAKDAIKLHEKNIEHNEELREYHEDKFSALGLYTWLASELQRSYREAYNMAYRMARYAEQAYRFEREDYEGRLLSGGYWDASRAGLLAGNRLTLELQYLEQRYIETDQPKRELIDHVFSLRQWDPMALIELRQKGECNFTVPELFFDISSPGDYRRRIRSVRVTIPAVAGPYVNVMATLSLGANWIRTSPKADLQEAPCPRVDSITTSSARNDAGAFELNFHGDKYMPFEGAGAVNSKWSLSLPTSVRMFDYNTISDVLLHFDYTASFDGVYRDFVQSVTEGQLSQLQQRLSDEGIVRAFSLREEFPPAFSRLLAGDTVELDIDEQHLPFFARDASVSEATLMLVGPDSDPLSVSSVEFDGEALGAPTVDERADDERVDKRAIGVSIALPMGGSLPWKHVVRLVELSGKLSNAYLVVKLQLPPRQDE
jgi:hypothetical protein